MDKFFLDRFLDLIFPPKCGYCGEITTSKKFICEKCNNLLLKSYINRCKLCGKISLVEKCPECEKKILYYEKLIFCSEYNREFKKKIHLYKFSDKKYLYHFFTELLYNYVKNEEFDVIIPVPISKERYRERGYNQSGLIAKKLAKLLNKECLDNVLVKEKNSKRQSTRSFKERIENVKNVFGVKNQPEIVDKKVLLVDDIFTTGSTANECAKMLKLADSGDIKIGVICISHMLR